MNGRNKKKTAAHCAAMSEAMSEVWRKYKESDPILAMRASKYIVYFPAGVESYAHCYKFISPGSARRYAREHFANLDGARWRFATLLYIKKIINSVNTCVTTEHLNRDKNTGEWLPEFWMPRQRKPCV